MAKAITFAMVILVGSHPVIAVRGLVNAMKNPWQYIKPFLSFFSLFLYVQTTIDDLCALKLLEDCILKVGLVRGCIVINSRSIFDPFFD